MTGAARTIGFYPEKLRLSVLVLLAAFGQPLLAQSPIQTALAATVTIEVDGGLSHGSGFITSSAA